MTGADELRATLLSPRHFAAVEAAEQKVGELLGELDELTANELEALAHLARRIEALHRQVAIAAERRYRGDA